MQFIYKTLIPTLKDWARKIPRTRDHVFERRGISKLSQNMNFKNRPVYF